MPAWRCCCNNNSRPHHLPLLLLLGRWPEALHRPLVMLRLWHQHRCCCRTRQLLLRLLLHVWPLLHQAPTWPGCCHKDCPWSHNTWPNRVMLLLLLWWGPLPRD